MSILVNMVCDADMCANFKKVQELRELMTVEDCERLHEYINGGGNN